jgi:hypothetical protein
MALSSLSLESFVKEANLHGNEQRTFTVKGNGTRLSGRYFLRRVTQSQDSIETAINAFKNAVIKEFDEDIANKVFAKYSNALDAKKVFGLTARTIKQVAGAAYLMRQKNLMESNEQIKKRFIG